MLYSAARLAANKSIANATDTLLSGADLASVCDGGRGRVGFDPPTSTVLSTSTLIVPHYDLWIVRFRGQFAPANTGIRAAKVLRNSTTVTTGSVASDARLTPGTGAEGAFDAHSLPMYLDAGDVLRFAVFQNSGAALNLLAAYFGAVLTGVSLVSAQASDNWNRS